MSFTRTVESRAYDHVYDPVYHTPYTGPVMRDGANSNTGALVGGTGRHKFFTRPVVPHLDAVAPKVGRVAVGSCPRCALRAPRSSQPPLSCEYRLFAHI
jgi:hypothetical protein